MYELHVPVEDTETLRKSLVVLREWAHAIRISDKDVDDERTIVLEEWRQQQTAATRAAVAYTKALVGDDSVYGVRMPIGLPDVIKGVGGAVLRHFYSRYYVPQNMAVVCVGDFAVPEDEVVSMVSEIFSSVEAPSNPTPPVTMAPVKLLDKPAVLIIPDEETTSSSVSVDVQMPKKIVRTEADYRETIVRDLFHRSLNNRLFKVSLLSARIWQRTVAGAAEAQAGVGSEAEAEAEAGGAADGGEGTAAEGEGSEPQGSEPQGGGLKRRYSVAMRNAPLLNGSSAYTNPVPPLETMQLAAAAQEGRVLPALRCLLVEVRNFA